MYQQGQVLALKTPGPGGEQLWAYRYRVDGRGSRRVQRGGFTSRDAAEDALQRALAKVRRHRGAGRTPTLAELVHEYLDQHDAEPETTDKLRWLLAKYVARFGEQRICDLQSREIAA